MKNVSKQKRRTKKYRQGAATEWIKNYEGQDIVKGYSKWFGVNLICAMRELRKKEVEIGAEEEKEIRQKNRQIEEQRRMNREKLKAKREEKKEQYDDFSNAEFAFIAGYTSGGVPFGLTHEEMKELEKEESYKSRATVNEQLSTDN